MASDQVPEYDVIVVGGGLSGLTAAYYLQLNKPDVKVLVLEAKDRVGGRTLTVQLQGYNGPDSWDLGGQWVCRWRNWWLLSLEGIQEWPHQQKTWTISPWRIWYARIHGPKGGAQPISIALVVKIGQENVLLGEPVTSIDQSEQDYVTVRTGTDKLFKCRRVICAAPVHCAASITYKPEPPMTRNALSDRMPVGHIFKFLVTYKTAFWRKAGYSGEVVSAGGQTSAAGCDTGPVQLVYDATSATNSPALVGFYANSRQWREIEPERRKAALLESLVEFFGPEAGQPIDFAEKDWGLEPYNGGCPVNFMSPGAITLYFDGLRKPFNRVHWAGTETGTQWSGFLNGAAQGGMRAAEEVLDALDPGWGRETSVLRMLDGKRGQDGRRWGDAWKYLAGAVAMGGVAFVGYVVISRYLRLKE